VRRFPKERLDEMTLEEYAVGLGSRESFCYWLEFGTKKLGHMAGYASKFGVRYEKDGWHWPKIYASAEDALTRIKAGLVALIEAVEQGRFGELDEIGGGFGHGLRVKPLSLYFPDEFLPVWQPDHLAYFLSLFGVKAYGDVLTRNLTLLHVLRDQPQFTGFDTMQMMRFLYQSFPPPDATKGGIGVRVSPPPPQPPPQPPADIPAELKQLLNITERTRNVLLYGPPGTGKTYLVQRFAAHFLSPQLTATTDIKRPHRLTLLQGLNWYEAIALTMLIADGKKEFKVPELAATEVLQDYVSLKSAATPQNTIHSELQRHTSPDNANVKVAFSNRKEPFLFDKNDRSEWSLTNAGAEYIEANLSNELSQLRNPQSDALDMEDYCDFVTFHQSFAYEEFVEGLKPVTAEDGAGGISYEIVPGVFRRICARAEAAWRVRGEDAPKYLLVIDEINRANIAKVLGELITLIEDDKRLGEANELTVRLPSPGARFGVPPNLYILGTMNTADRSIALLDLALRRRFTFVEMRPQPDVIEPPVVAGVDLRALLIRLNERIAALRDRDHQIGHSYLLRLTDADDLHFAWYRRIVPLLQEYFYNDGERLKAVIGSRFVQPVKMSKAASAALKELYDAEQPPYEVVELQGEEFLNALRALAGAAEEVEAATP